MFEINRADHMKKMLADLSAKKEKNAAILAIRKNAYLQNESNSVKASDVNAIKSEKQATFKVTEWKMISDEDQSGMLIPAN